MTAVALDQPTAAILPASKRTGGDPWRIAALGLVSRLVCQSCLACSDAAISPHVVALLLGTGSSSAAHVLALRRDPFSGNLFQLGVKAPTEATASQSQLEAQSHPPRYSAFLKPSSPTFRHSPLNNPAYVARRVHDGAHSLE
jgi:hypothetical protein